MSRPSLQRKISQIQPKKPGGEDPYQLKMSSPKSSRRSRRIRTESSLSGMFIPDEGTSPETYEDNSSEMVSLARKLRQTKRQLFLKSVQQPSTPVDQLRKLVLDLTVDSMEDSPEGPVFRGLDSPIERPEFHRNRSNSANSECSCD